MIGDDLGRFSLQFNLTSRQRDVFTMLVEGVSPKEMAHRLSISHVTVRRHAEELYRRCGTSNQRETLALFARLVMLGAHAERQRSAG
jgi:DNA-binding NarL/FixJ family response regulator